MKSKWAGALGLLLVVSQGLAGQQHHKVRVYQASEVSSLPILAAPEQAVATIRSAYPAKFKYQGIDGRVVLQLVVRADGGVDSESIEVLTSTNTAFGQAAREAMRSVRFVPGRVNRKSVSTRIQFPVNFRGATQ